MRLEIELVGGRHDGTAVIGQILFPAGVDDAQDGAGLFLVHRVQMGQMLPVSGEPHGHHRHALYRGIQRRQVGQRLFQLRPVVPAGAADDLRVDLYPCPGKGIQMPQTFAAPGIAQHFCAQVGVGGMHRDVQRRDVHADDPVRVLVAEIGHGDVIAQQEGKARVVILKIKAFAHPLRKLVDKAKDASVGAALLGVHQISFELQPQVLSLPLADGNGALAPPGVPHPERDMGVVGIKFVIHHVADGVIPDGKKRFAHPQAGFVRRRAGVDPGDDGGHIHSPFAFAFAAKRRSVKNGEDRGPLHFLCCFIFPLQLPTPYGRRNSRKPCRLCGTERARRTWGTSPGRAEPASSGNCGACRDAAWKFALSVLPFRHLLIYGNKIYFTLIYVLFFDPETPAAQPAWDRSPGGRSRSRRH